MSESLLNCTIELLGLFIYLWMTGCDEVLFGSQHPGYEVRELSKKSAFRYR